MLPNLHAVLAESPELYQAYGQLNDLFSASSLSTDERHVVWLTINVYHSCHYCVPAHTFLALKDGVSEDVVDALRAGQTLPDARLEALRQFTLSVTEKRGEVDAGEIDAFLAAGFTKTQRVRRDPWSEPQGDLELREPHRRHAGRRAVCKIRLEKRRGLTRRE
ncbi:MAG: carboxymuconolactone decarboxylase family protein [Pseudomonadota bacterium]